MQALLLAVALTLSASPAGAIVAFELDDERIDESSGLAASSTRDGVVFTHNDSGDDARFFAVDDEGRTLATYRLPDVQARDWEDMARGPDERGRSSLWLGDIGDNSARRTNGILVHRVLEPVPGQDRRVRTAPPESFRLRYPDGPTDAEGLAVHPTTGRLHVVAKPLGGPASVYAAPQPLDPDGPNLLERVGEVRTRATGTAGGPGIGSLAQRLVTAAAFSPDGARFAVRTYTDVYEYAVSEGDLDAALRRDPAVTALPETRQGEGLTYTRDGAALLTSSEGRGAPVHRVPVADLTGAEQQPGSGQQGSEQQPGSEQQGSEQQPGSEQRAAVRRPLLLGGVGALLLVAGLLLRRRRTRAPGGRR